MKNSSKTKLLIASKLYTPWIGGVETFIQQIAEGLDQNEFDIEVLVCQSRGIGRVDCINEVKITRTSSFGMVLGMPLSPTYIYHYLRKSIKNSTILLNTPYPLGVLSAVITNSLNKTTIVYHSDIIRQKTVLKLYKPVLNFALKRVKQIVTSNPVLPKSSKLLTHYQDKIHVIPFGINTDKYAITESMNDRIEKIGDKYNEKIVLFVGRLIYYKGLSHLIEAMHEVDAHCILIGDGPDKEHLLEKARKLKISEKFTILRSKSKRDLIPYYQAADVFVLPSTHSSEAFGLVQLEAMASGTAIINTRLLTGVPWVSRHGESGLTVTPGSSKELAGALQLLLNDDEKRYELSLGGFKRALQVFSLEKMLKDYSSLLK